MSRQQELSSWMKRVWFKSRWSNWQRSDRIRIRIISHYLARWKSSHAWQWLFILGRQKVYRLVVRLNRGACGTAYLLHRWGILHIYEGSKCRRWGFDRLLKGPPRIMSDSTSRDAQSWVSIVLIILLLARGSTGIDIGLVAGSTVGCLRLLPLVLLSSFSR